MHSVSSVQASAREEIQQVTRTLVHRVTSNDFSFAMLCIKIHHCYRLGKSGKFSIGFLFFICCVCQPKKKMTVRTIFVRSHIDNKRSFQRQFGEVQAGNLHDTNIHCHPNILSLEEDGHGSDVLLVLLPDGNTSITARDFALVMKSNHAATTVSSFVKKEMIAIRGGVIRSRADPCTGVFNPLSGYKCQNFTELTRKPTNFQFSYCFFLYGVAPSIISAVLATNASAAPAYSSSSSSDPCHNACSLSSR